MLVTVSPYLEVGRALDVDQKKKQNELLDRILPGFQEKISNQQLLKLETAAHQFQDLVT